MEFRRYYGLRASRPIGLSTYMAPQLENYALFSHPFIELQKKLGRIAGKLQRDVQDQSETVTDTKSRRKSKLKGARTEEEKQTKADQQVSSEDEEGNIDFGIVLNVASVQSDELVISFEEGNEITVTVNQANAELKRMGINFSRECTYKYQLPDDINKHSLRALITSDDYLIILPKEELKDELFIETIKAVKKPIKSSDREASASVETGSTDRIESNIPKAVESEETTTRVTRAKAKKGSEDEKKKSTSKGSEDGAKADEKSGAGEATGGDGEFDPPVFSTKSGLIPVRVSRMLRQGLDIFMLRKYMVDLESSVAIARKFVENASFILENSKTAEIFIRKEATQIVDKFYEDYNKQAEQSTELTLQLSKPVKSSESGYFSNKPTPEVSEDSLSSAKSAEADKLASVATDESSSGSTSKSAEVDKSTPTASDDSSRSSSTKSEEVDKLTTVASDESSRSSSNTGDAPLEPPEE